MTLINILFVVSLATAFEYKYDSLESFHRRIIGGQEAVPHSIPYQVYIALNSPNYYETYYCGGTLLTPNYVLTAAQCIEQASESQIILGAHAPVEPEDSQIVYYSQDFKIHPNFSHTFKYNDIGVIKLSKPVQLSEAIQLVNLTTKNDINQSFVDEIVRTSGWGLTDGFDDDSNSDVLRYLDAPVVGFDNCSYYFGQLRDFHFCTYAEMSMSCFGDIGGPVVLDGLQIGIASSLMPMCLDNYPSVVAKVALYLDWIAENTDWKG